MDRRNKKILNENREHIRSIYIVKSLDEAKQYEGRTDYDTKLFICPDGEEIPDLFDLKLYGGITISQNGDNQFYDFAKDVLDKTADDVQICGEGLSVPKEYFYSGEKKIKEVLQGINSNWDKRQKTAYIHMQMGKLATYRPDSKFNDVNKLGQPELFSKDSPERNAKFNAMCHRDRNPWAVASTGIGVCLGIAALEQMLNSRAGVEAKILRGYHHEYICAEVEEGNLLEDGTWDLWQSLFDVRPQCFGKSYDEFRGIDTVFRESHKLSKDQIPENVVSLDNNEVKELYKSIGYVGDDDTFKAETFKKLLKLAQNEEEKNKPKAEKLDDVLNIFQVESPEAILHYSEFLRVLQMSLVSLGINPEERDIEFVYSKEDLDCESPILAIHLRNEKSKDVITLFNSSTKTFEKCDIRSVSEKYKTHFLNHERAFWEEDLQKQESDKHQNNDTYVKEPTGKTR